MIKKAVPEKAKDGSKNVENGARFVEKEDGAEGDGEGGVDAPKAKRLRRLTKSKTISEDR